MSKTFPSGKQKMAINCIFSNNKRKRVWNKILVQIYAKYEWEKDI